MDRRVCDLLVCVLGASLLQSTIGLDADLLDGYWAGEIPLPPAIDSDVASYLSEQDVGALTRAAVWIARNHFLSGSVPKHHMSLVRWLYEQGHVVRSELLSLLGLLSLSSLDQAGVEIALFSRDALEEGREEEGLDLIEPMLLGYRPTL